MKGKFFPAIAFLIYWLKKEDRYSQQSPHIFSLYTELIRFLGENKKGSKEIERFRKRLLNDKSVIEVLDLGAGSKKVPQTLRQVKRITRYSTSGIKFCQLYKFFCSLTPARHVIELGTCVGISTRYLSESVTGKLYTFEGSPEIQKVAMKDSKPDRTEFILGAIEKSLPSLLNKIPVVDFALLDANHTYEGTINAFNLLLEKVEKHTIIAIGDIHWTPEMERAWKEVKLNPKVMLTLDFYECGIVFFDFSGKKTDLILAI